MPRLFYYQFEVTAETESGQVGRCVLDIRAKSAAEGYHQAMGKAKARFPASLGFSHWDLLPTKVGA
jgi:hypothetical protein